MISFYQVEFRNISQIYSLKIFIDMIHIFHRKISSCSKCRFRYNYIHPEVYQRYIKFHIVKLILQEQMTLISNLRYISKVQV